MLPPDTAEWAVEVVNEAARRPILDVEFYRFEGKTCVVESEMERLNKDAVTPTFKKPPRWHAARDGLGISIGMSLFPLFGILIVYVTVPSLFGIFGPLLVMAMAGMAFLSYWILYHVMEIRPDDGKYGKADPDQAYKGLVLIIRDVVRSESYGFKLTRYQAIIAHNYNFTIIPSEGSKERLHLIVYKRYNSDELRIQNTRAAGEKRPTYLKFKNVIEERLSRQAV